MSGKVRVKRKRKCTVRTMWQEGQIVTNEKLTGMFVVGGSMKMALEGIKTG